jgi:hypothetical protein
LDEGAVWRDRVAATATSFAVALPDGIELSLGWVGIRVDVDIVTSKKAIDRAPFGLR